MYLHILFLNQCIYSGKHFHAPVPLPSISSRMSCIGLCPQKLTPHSDSSEMQTIKAVRSVVLPLQEKTWAAVITDT